MSSGRHHETLQETPVELPSERSTGLVLAVVAVIAAVLLREVPAAAAAAGSVGVILALFAWIAPQRLRGLNRAWFRFGLLLNRFISPVVMLAIYGLVIVPAGLIMQRLRDPLQARGRHGGASYWIEREHGPPRGGMRDQF